MSTKSYGFEGRRAKGRNRHIYPRDWVRKMALPGPIVLRYMPLCEALHAELRSDEPGTYLAILHTDDLEHLPERYCSQCRRRYVEIMAEENPIDGETP